MIVNGCSFPKIERNNIYGNCTSGVILRDNSTCYIKENKVRIADHRVN
jgi:parallel beta-helix repeat protein